jgi:hypothetical protein
VSSLVPGDLAGSLSALAVMGITFLDLFTVIALFEILFYSVDDFLSAAWLLISAAIEELVELSLINISIALVLLDLFLEHVNLLHVLSLFLMSLSLFVCLDGLVELFVFEA